MPLGSIVKLNSPSSCWSSTMSAKKAVIMDASLQQCAARMDDKIIICSNEKNSIHYMGFRLIAIIGEKWSNSHNLETKFRLIAINYFLKY